MTERGLLRMAGPMGILLLLVAALLFSRAIRPQLPPPDCDVEDSSSGCTTEGDTQTCFISAQLYCSDVAEYCQYDATWNEVDDSEFGIDQRLKCDPPLID